MARTAAALIIGNEILTGKVQEQNVACLAQELFQLGVSLQRVVICGDDLDTIAAEINELRPRFDAVFTSGGVGPTLDDVTVRAVARAFDRPLVRSPELAGLLHRFFGEAITETHLRMADLPQDTELVRTPDMPWPMVLVENVYVLPGLPEVFRMKLPAIRLRLGADAPFVSRALFTRCQETEIAELLERIAAAHPTVMLGSYPRWHNEAYDTKLTVDGQDSQAVAAALADLRAGLPAERLVEPPPDEP